MRRNHLLMRTAIRSFFTRRLLVVVVGTASIGAALAPAQTTWHVDDDAPGDPAPGDPSISDPLEDGSAEHPFDAIQEGIDAAVDGDTVLVLNGMYTGDGNRDLDFGGRLITVRSENGPDTCIIDCEHAGRGFYFHSAETADAVVDGFTITNGTESGIVCSWSGCNPTICDCTITGNTAYRGGGVSGAATIVNCTITANTAHEGGGVGCGLGTTIADCTISANTAEDNGGGIYGGETSLVTIADCIISANTAGEQGGGVAWLGGTLTIANCTIIGNTSGHDAGGVYSGPGATISECTITENAADDSGGGVRCWGNTTVARCDITENQAYQGAGILCSGDDATIADCTIARNSATSSYEFGNGGGVYCNFGSPGITGCVIADNTADGAGGGLYCYYSSSPTITNCTIAGNQSDNYGGGIHCTDLSSPTIVNSTIAANVAQGRGGGICCEQGSSPTIANSTITRNSGFRGAGICSYRWSSAAIVNCAITSNTATGSNGGGGGVDCDDSSNSVITNCTIAGNAARYGGGIRSRRRSSARVENCVLWANSAAEGAEIAVMSYDSTMNLAYCDVAEGQAAAYVEADCTLNWGPGNIDADPLFVDPDGPDDDPDTWEDNDFHLSAGSPCIDAGCNCAVPPDTLDLDGDGDTGEYTPFDRDGDGRFFDDPATDDTGSGLPPIVDMGAYEFGGSDEPPCRGDLDGDRDVDWEDLAVLLDHYGALEGATGADGDMDCDGDIELSDLAALLSVYGTGCP